MNYSCMILAFSLVVFSVFPIKAQQEIPPRKTIELKGGKADPIPPGPFQPSWESIRQNYKVPTWFLDAKFGIFMHWGVYSVAATASEWYPRHMYSNAGVHKTHEEKFGVGTGYKDIVPLFKAEMFDPVEWADLLVKSGAKYVIPTAEHHDGFAMYDSKLTRWDAMDMGPHRDLIGDLCKAVRARGLKFGVSNHRMENWDFMYPRLSGPNDLYDPAYADFYGPPQKPDTTKVSSMGPNAEDVMEGEVKVAPQSQAFLEEWLARCQELIDKYQPDMLWFDNGVNSRSLDSIKLRLAAYYYNRAVEWGKPVSLSTKSKAYLEGSIKDFERQGRAPGQLTDYPWQVDEPIGNKFGYIEGLQLQNSASVIKKLVTNISRNGNLMLNISPKGDGTIPDDQRKVLLEVGAWLKVNGDGVYGTRAWIKDAESVTNADGKSVLAYRFTKKGNNLYAFLMIAPNKSATIQSYSTEAIGKVKEVRLLGYDKKLTFKQSVNGLIVQFPDEIKPEAIATLKVVLK